MVDAAPAQDFSSREEWAFAAMRAAFRRGRGDENPEVAAMKENRRVNARKTAAASSGGGAGLGAGSLTFATGRPRDPLFYWKQNNLPYELTRSAELARLRAYCRLLYASHPVVASCVDIYTKYPLLGMELRCFAGETPVLTETGTKQIRDLAGGIHSILTTGGKWVDAKFDNYGYQPLVRLEVSRNGRTREIFTTAGHRWYVWDTEGPGKSKAGAQNPSAKLTWESVQEIRRRYAAGGVTQSALASEFGVTQKMISGITSGTSWKSSGEKPQEVARLHPVKREVQTSDLTQGMKLVSCFPTARVHSTNPSPFGIAHGMVVGDGTLSTSGRGATVDLWGEKDAQMLKYYPGCEIYQINDRCTRVTNLPAFFKSLPDINESQSYLYGWLAGYFAADGTVSKKGEVIIDSVSRENLQFARDVCSRLGIKTYDLYEVNVGEKVTPQGGTLHNWRGYRLPIDPDSLSAAFFCIAHHRERWESRPERVRARREDWTVVSVQETSRVEEVFCAEVPETEAFTLEGNILTGNCKDEKIKDFYTELFMDEDRLNYPEFLLRLGREYWTVGEAWPFATFNEPLGIWESEELLNADDIEVQSSPFLKDPRFLIRLPKTLREVIAKRQPVWEYEQLIAAYPELARFSGDDDKMPVSNILLRQMKFEADTFNPRGVPILMRAMRPIMQEEMLNAAQDAIADRLYTPLILCRLGASATDLGTKVPWIPTPDDLEEFEQAMDAALAGDFRMLTYHFGVDISSVFGAETMPDLSEHFDRLEGRILLSFGLSSTMLTGSSAGETYAGDALNRDLVSQLLTTYQTVIKRHVRQRALIVAEAQEHYDYEERGGRRYVKYEEILEIDEETGQESIVRQPKLLVPAMHCKTMALSDDTEQRQFLEALRESGIPISMKTRLTNIPVDFDEEVERSSAEQVQLAVAEQQTRKDTYIALRAQALPIPSDLRTDFEPKAMQAQTPSATEGMRTPTLGLDPTGAYPNLAPTPEDLQDPDADLDAPPVEPGADLAPAEEGEDPGAEGDGARPEESDEQRSGMPKPASLHRQARRMREVADTHRPKAATPDGRPRRRSGFDEPRHIGLRRHAVLDYDNPIAED